MSRPTRREALEAGFDAVEKGEPIPEVVESPQLELEVQDGAQASKPREPDGKFAKAEQAAPEQQDDPYAKPPASWKPEYRNKYPTLDPEVRKYLHQREEEQQKGVEPLKQAHRRLEAIDQTFAAIKPDLDRNGVAPELFLRDVVQTVATLAKGDPQSKFQTWLNIGKTYGVPMHLMQQMMGQQPQVDQVTQQLWQELHGLKQTFQSQQQAREQQEWAEVAKTVQQVQENKEKYPHFEAVRQTMGQLIQTGVSADLDDAYNKAIRLHDDIWQEQQKQQLESAIQSKRSEADKAAKAAKAAAVSTRSSTPAGREASAAVKGRRASLEAAFEQHMGSGRV